MGSVKRQSDRHLFVVEFEDQSDKLDVRERYLAKHIEYLDRVKEKVLVAGSLRQGDREQPIGGLWIVEAEDEKEVRALVDEDPFWANGLRTSCRIFRWSKAFPERNVPV